MFGLLRKKLKESIKKLRGAVEEAPEESIAEEIPVSKEVEVGKLPIEAGKEEEVAPEILAPVPEEAKEDIKRELVPEGPEKREGILRRIRKKITEKVISEKDVSDVLDSMQMELLRSDVALEVTEKIIGDLKKALIGRSVSRKRVGSIVEDALSRSLTDILSQDGIDIMGLAKERRPLTVVFLGFNGTGKTTTIARLAHLLKKKGLRCILAAGDTFRAASIEQLEEHGRNLGIEVIKQKYGSDSAAVIFDAVKAARSRGYDVVLADTAGRSHANANLMDEMKKIIRVNKPDLKILVVDCLTGNDAVEQAKKFNDAVGIDGVIMTKADVYDKGGAVLSVTHTIKAPILYIGTGQGYDDLQEFRPEEVVKGLLGQ